MSNRFSSSTHSVVPMVHVICMISFFTRVHFFSFNNHVIRNRLHGYQCCCLHLTMTTESSITNIIVKWNGPSQLTQNADSGLNT